MMTRHDDKTCPVCAPYVNTVAYRRGVARAEADMQGAGR